jgi:hypothetical protein
MLTLNIKIERCIKHRKRNKNKIIVMWKLLAAFIEFLNWLAIFAASFIVGAGIGLVIYINNQNLLWLSIVFTSAGAIAGVLIAEHIRKKYGCSRYLARIRATPDIWPDEDWRCLFLYANSRKK